MKQKRDLSFIIGNALMAGSFLILLFIYSPLISLYIKPLSVQSSEVNKSFYIMIPKISVISSVVPNVDPFKEEEYRRALKNGIAQAKGTSLPGEKGTIYLFAHSSGPPWELTRYNTIFFRLDDLRPNDEIILIKSGQKHLYKVTDKKIVWPQDTKYLMGKDTPDQLIIQTCYPLGTDFKRLLVFARPI